MALKEGFGFRLALKVVPPVFKGLTALLFATCKLEEHDQHYFQPFIEEKKPCIFSGWHYTIFYNIYRAYKTRKEHGLRWAFMVSTSRDAEFIAAVLHSMGLDTARGSRNRGGIAALKKMIPMVKEGRCAGIVADGSQGPARELQAGAILLASKTGAPILPIAWAVDKYIAFGSWDRTVLPKPFSRISMWYGEPLYIPAKLKSAELEEYRLEGEKRLNELYHKAWAEFGRKEH